jgi:hypothetical protein
MNTSCAAGALDFYGLGRRATMGQINGGKVSSDSGEPSPR